MSNIIQMDTSQPLYPQLSSIIDAPVPQLTQPSMQPSPSPSPAPQPQSNEMLTTLLGYTPTQQQPYYNPPQSPQELHTPPSEVYNPRMIVNNEDTLRRDMQSPESSNLNYEQNFSSESDSSASDSESNEIELDMSSIQKKKRKRGNGKRSSSGRSPSAKKRKSKKSKGKSVRRGGKPSLTNLRGKGVRGGRGRGRGCAAAATRRPRALTLKPLKIKDPVTDEPLADTLLACNVKFDTHDAKDKVVHAFDSALKDSFDTFRDHFYKVFQVK